ncbi:MAG: TonB-dependent receptor [Vicinamibacteraceae bacterium]
MFTSLAYGQIRSGTITGTVTDASGAVVPGASVVVTNEATNVATEIVTTEAGQFTAPYLSAGTYTVAVSLSGFVPYRETGVVLAATETVRVSAELRVSNIDEAVEVTAAPARLQTDRATVAGAMEAAVIEALPNVTQNPLQYAMSQAGVVPRNNATNTTGLNSFGIGVDGRRQWSAIGVNGGRAFTNDIQLDGLPVMGGGYNEASVVPNTEGLQEVRVISNNFSAEYGRGQAVIAMSTKSGTNQFHGQGVYMVRDEALDATTFEDNALDQEQPPFRVDDAGGSIGGPIIRNKLFFFSSYHGLRHDNGQNVLATVPTAGERVGDFSQTLIRDESGNPVPARVFDPWNVVQEGPDLYRRQEVPNAIIPNPDPHALLIYGFYPQPNRTPDDVFHTNNFEASIVETVRRHGVNNRVDLRLGSHSIYGSGGISYAEIITPRPFGESPFNGAAGERGDNNPYVQVGDTFVLNDTTVVDVRYGVSRINTKAFAGDKTGFTDELYDAFGVPSNLRPLMLLPGAAPNINPNGFGGGSGGGSNWTSLTTGNFNTKQELQTGHSLSGSLSKIRGRWTHKVGGEFRNLLSNYADPEQASVAFPAPFQHVGGNYNFEYVTANGGVAPQTATNAQKGVNGAGMLLGTGLVWIRPGASIRPAFSQKYFAVYSQNDWRATDRLTINLGLRWEVQPGPTERFDRMSSWDVTRENAFGAMGAIAFPGVDGYSRNLWDTTYDNWGPRVGAAYQLTDRTVVRGGFGVTYLPSNSGFFSGPTDYGSANFSGGVTQRPYGLDPHGVPVARFSDDAPLAPAIGGDPANPGVYGIGEARFDRHHTNGRAIQWNVFVERMLGNTWSASIGYSASVSRNLLNRSFPVQNLQSLPPELLADWREQYIASNGTLDPANEEVPNPFQPSGGDPLAFSGILGNETLPRANTRFPYPLLIGSNAAVNSSRATADYHSLQLRLSRRFSTGLAVDAHYTWSKNIDSTDTHEDNQGFNAGASSRNYSLLDMDVNRKLGHSDVPHRFVATFVYDLPFGTERAVPIGNAILRAFAGGWQVSGTAFWQSGFPIGVSGASTGAALTRPDRVEGVPLELPGSLQGWYDGETTVTLPSGRSITPPANTFLRFNPDAFAGRVVTTPDGSIVPDVYWFGNAALTYDDFRTDARFNLDLSIRRTFRLWQDVSIDIGADIMNILNHTQFSGSYGGNLGATNTVDEAGNGLIPGMGSENGFGSRGMDTFNPRQIMLRAAVRF